MNIYLSLLLSFLLALFAYLKKSMTTPALILAFIFAFLITYYGGLSSFLMLTTVFLSTVIAGKIKTTQRKEITKDIHEKGHKKDIMSIIANVAPGTLAIILYYLTKNTCYLIVYAALMAEAISDSLASDIGVLSKKEPINILTFKKSKAGLSGNISLLGVIASLIGSLLIALIYLIFSHNLTNFLIITTCGFLGNFIDSYLGALFQVKYKCSKCGIITEKENHCNTPTKYYHGIKHLNNDMINLLSNTLAGFLCYLLLILS